eukprot:6212744-Pleurochrysis_carterae.AAC.5
MQNRCRVDPRRLETNCSFRVAGGVGAKTESSRGQCANNLYQTEAGRHMNDLQLLGHERIGASAVYLHAGEPRAWHTHCTHVHALPRPQVTMSPSTE